MTGALRWSRRAVQDLRNLDPPDARRIVTRVERFAGTGHGDVKKLKGEEDRWRLRVGGWRVLFTFVEDGDVLLVLRVLSRGKAYG